MGTNEAADAVEVNVPEAPGAQSPPPTRVKPGSPLSVRISSVFLGEKDLGRSAILTSAVRSPMLGDAKPLAMHYLYEKARYGQVLTPRADEPGSDIIYYSPAETAGSLDLAVRLAFDRFDKETFDSWIDAAATAAGLPVFAVSGPTGAGWLAMAQNAAKFVTRLVDNAIDGDNDRVMTWRINLSDPGRPVTRAGYVLLYPDGNELLPAPVTDEDADTVSTSGAFELDGNRFVVRDGKLCWADDPNRFVREGDAYVLVYVNGAKLRGMESWAAAAVSADLAEKFLNARSNGAADALEAFRLFNDFRWVKEIGSIDRELAALRKSSDSPANTKKIKELEALRTAAQENIGDSVVRDLYNSLTEGSSK